MKNESHAELSAALWPDAKQLPAKVLECRHCGRQPGIPCRYQSCRHSHRPQHRGREQHGLDGRHRAEQQADAGSELHIRGAELLPHEARHPPYRRHCEPGHAVPPPGSNRPTPGGQQQPDCTRQPDE